MKHDAGSCPAVDAKFEAVHMLSDITVYQASPWIIVWCFGGKSMSERGPVASMFGCRVREPLTARIRRHDAAGLMVGLTMSCRLLLQMMALYESEDSESLNEMLVAQGVARLASTAARMATSPVRDGSIRLALLSFERRAGGMPAGGEVGVVSGCPSGGQLAPLHGLLRSSMELRRPRVLG